MNTTRIKSRAFSHRAVLSAAIAAILVMPSAADSLSIERSNDLRQIYKLNFTVTPKDQTVLFMIDVVDVESGEVVWSPKLTSHINVQDATMKATRGAHDIELRLRWTADLATEVFIKVKENGELVQRNLYTYTPGAAPPPKSSYTGAPMSLNLKDADIRDVMRTFGELTGLDIAVAGDVQGKVTMMAENVPWDEMLQRIADENGLKIEIDGKTIRVTRK